MDLVLFLVYLFVLNVIDLECSLLSDKAILPLQSIEFFHVYFSE